MTKIWSHTLVRNEERYVWYSIMSVIDQVDRMLVWDMGSEDKTFDILEKIKKEYPDKVELNKCKKDDDYTKLRQDMLGMTKSDWVMILDGDEVWWKDSLKKVLSNIERKKDRLESIITPYFNIVGDIFHYQPEVAGRYKIDDRYGHITIRFINRNIPGLYTRRPHGQHGYFDQEDKLIQDRSIKKRKFIDAPFMHFTHIRRSTSKMLDESVHKRDKKYKVELGNEFTLDFYYPEIFFRDRPEIIRSPWEVMNKSYKIKATLSTLPLNLKRRIIKGKSGY